MNKDLVFYNKCRDTGYSNYNPTYKLSEKQQIFLRWYMIARMDGLIDGDSWSDNRIDNIILEKEYTSDTKHLLNVIREKYTIQHLKQLVEDSIKSGRT
jgi:hypothetical protein